MLELGIDDDKPPYLQFKQDMNIRVDVKEFKDGMDLSGLAINPERAGTTKDLICRQELLQILWLSGNLKLTDILFKLIHPQTSFSN